MEFRLRAATPIALALPAEAVARRRGHAPPEAGAAAGRVAMFPAALHGALGARLRRRTCPSRRPVCTDCGASCLYARIFRPADGSPAPLRLEVPALRGLPNVLPPGETIDLALILLGPAATHAFDIRDALLETGEVGFGEPGLFGVDGRQEFAVAESRFLPESLAPGPSPARVRLTFETPWLSRRGQWGAGALFTTLRSRVDHGLDAAYGDGVRAGYAYPLATESLRLRWLSFAEETWSTHYDPFRARAAADQYVAGRVGGAWLEGDLAPFWDLLRLGAALGVGARTPLGFGRYRLHDAE